MQSSLLLFLTKAFSHSLSNLGYVYSIQHNKYIGFKDENSKYMSTVDYPNLPVLVKSGANQGKVIVYDPLNVKNYVWDMNLGNYKIYFYKRHNKENQNFLFEHVSPNEFIIKVSNRCLYIDENKELSTKRCESLSQTETFKFVNLYSVSLPENNKIEEESTVGEPKLKKRNLLDEIDLVKPAININLFGGNEDIDASEDLESEIIENEDLDLTGREYEIKKRNDREKSNLKKQDINIHEKMYHNGEHYY